MFKKILIALIVVGSLVIGYARLAQASHNCTSDSTIVAANPELAVACRYHDSVTGDEPELSQTTEAGEGRSNDLTDSTTLAANPELKLAHRFIPPENEIDPDRDIGLLEFFTGSNELVSQPVIIDPEALRQFHTQPRVIWVIMPDGSDPSPLMQPADKGGEMTESDFLAANPELNLVRRYPADAIESVSSLPNPFERTANELARQQNYIAGHVRQAALERDMFPAPTLAANSGLTVAQCVAVMERWNRLNHLGR